MSIYPAAQKRAETLSRCLVPQEYLAEQIHRAIDDHLKSEIGDDIYMRRRELCSDCSGKASGLNCGDCTTGFMDTYHADHLKSEGWKDLRDAAILLLHGDGPDDLFEAISRMDEALRRVGEA